MEQLQYDQVNGVSIVSPVAQYNGNIASQSWGTSSSPDSAAFVYTYDQLNRLTSGMSADSNFAEQNITYDQGGNIQSLSRTYNGDVIDNLSYIYTNNGVQGNQLQQITNSSSLGTMYGPGISAGTFGYAYDGNGNMIADTGKSVFIQYNILNLPQAISPNPIQTGNRIILTAVQPSAYQYDADGTKLMMRSGIRPYNITYYISGIQYDYSPTLDSLTLTFVQTEDGRVFPYSADTSNYYEYNLADHLGNNRIAFDNPGNARATVEQQDNYLPFGMEISQLVNSPKNEYLYNGKELQEAFNLYDYGARFYDPVIGRWMSVDPLAEDDEDLSPYIYGENNPILMTDPDGMSAEETTNVEEEKPKPAPKPIELKEVTIKGYVAKKQHLGSYEYTIYVPDEATAKANRKQLGDFLGKWTPLGREVMAYLSTVDLVKHMDFSRLERQE